jgi:hypothetical protein
MKVAAGLAEEDVTAEGLRPAGLDGEHGPKMAFWHPGTELLPVRRAMSPEDLGEIGHTLRSKTLLIILNAVRAAVGVRCV